MISSVTVLAAMASAFVAGRLIDGDARWARIVFPSAAVLGLVAHLMLARIRWRREGDVPRASPREAERFGSAVRTGWSSTWRTLRDDRDFRAFELAFVLYGTGLLLAVPLIVAYAERGLGLTTGEWTLADRFALPMTQLLIMPFVGRVADRIGVVRVAALGFALVGAFFLAMIFVRDAGSLIAAYVLYGVCMAAVNVSWALGPLLFAPAGQAHHYGSVHMAMVGVRSLVGPALGYVVARLASFRAALGLAVAFEVAAVVLALGLARRVHAR
jgi:MFS family permease